jgi:MFS family permease
MVYDNKQADPQIAFLMITAKLSDVWGLKNLLLSCALVFLACSMACGAAQSMIQLCVDQQSHCSRY